tara:strand:- start:7 stop:234 length:228 start_codon:yes stop_codon:yes gene_type:complete
MLKTLISFVQKLRLEIQFLESDIEEKKIRLREAEEVIYQNCQHNWITDYIDIDLDTSKTIIYCKYCCLNKNQVLY